MFCPRCSSENSTDRKYCHQCGLPLGAVSLALEGRVDEAMAELNKATHRLSGSLKAFGVFLLIVLVMLLLKGQLGLFSFTASALFGLIVSVPFLFTVLAKFRRADGLLNGQVQPKRLATDQPDRLGAQLPPASINDLSIIRPEIPGSVTERTTQALKRPKGR